MSEKIDVEPIRARTLIFLYGVQGFEDFLISDDNWVISSLSRADKRGRGLSRSGWKVMLRIGLNNWKKYLEATSSTTDCPWTSWPSSSRIDRILLEFHLFLTIEKNLVFLSPEASQVTLDFCYIKVSSNSRPLHSVRRQTLSFSMRLKRIGLEQKLSMMKGIRSNGDRRIEVTSSSVQGYQRLLCHFELLKENIERIAMNIAVPNRRNAVQEPVQFG